MTGTSARVGRVSLHSLQYLRAIAALFVVYSHAVLQVEPYRVHMHEFGGFGVDVFFVISGFIMAYIARPDDNPRRFLANRVRRVVPLYWFFTLLLVVILLALPAVFKSSVFDAGKTLLSLLFIPHYSDAYPTMVWPIVAPGWSLNYEMYFYLVFALSLLFPQAIRLWVTSAVLAIGFTLAWATPGTGAFSEFFRDSIILEFVLGMGLAVMYKRGFRLPPLLAWGLFLAGLVLLLVKFPVPRIFTWGIPALMVVAGMLYSRLPKMSWFVLLGDASYALYLSHLFTLGVCRKLLPGVLGDSQGAGYVFVLVSMLLCIAVSIVVHFLVDNWLLRRERLQWFTQSQRHADSNP